MAMSCCYTHRSEIAFLTTSSRGCAVHRAELLAYLDWEAEADRLVLDSTERLADAWPAGCPLDGPEWQREEDSLATAYRSMDLDRLIRALADRELCAGTHFDAYRKEVAK